MRLHRLGAALGVGALVAGCYTLRPVPGASPDVGMRVAFDVNDAGRVALGGTMGPEIAQVEGHVLQKDGEGYLIAVSNIRLLRGGEQVWTGEQVRLKPEFLGNTYLRRFSMGRSVALGVVSVGGFAAFLATRSLFGLGNQDDNTPPGDTVDARLGRP